MSCFFPHIDGVILRLSLFHAARKDLETHEKVELYHAKSGAGEISLYIYIIHSMYLSHTMT